MSHKDKTQLAGLLHRWTAMLVVCATGTGCQLQVRESRRQPVATPVVQTPAAMAQPAAEQKEPAPQVVVEQPKCPPVPASGAQGELRFPFGIVPAWTVEKHQECFGGSELDLGEGRVVYSVHDEGFHLTLGHFQGREADLHYLDGRLYRVVAEATYDECDEAAMALRHVAEYIEVYYKQGGVTKSPSWGSTACRDYMDEGGVSAGRATDTWEVLVTSYWYKGKFKVYVAWTYLPLYNLLVMKRQEDHSQKVDETLNKL